MYVNTISYIEKAVKGFRFSVFGHMDNTTGFVVQNYGQVAVAPSDRYFIDGQDAKSIIVYLAIVGFQILFVDFLDRFPIQLKMSGHLGDRHHLAELMDIRCQSPGNP